MAPGQIQELSLEGQNQEFIYFQDTRFSLTQRILVFATNSKSLIPLFFLSEDIDISNNDHLI